MLIHDADITGSFLYNGVNISNVTGSAASLTALNQFSASINLFTGSYNTGSFTGSFIGNGSGLNGVVSASFALTATSASQASNANTATSASQASNTISSSYAATSSFASSFTVANTLTATTLVVNTISSSVVYSSGSNIFGNSLSNTQVFTGSLQVTGSTHYLLGNVGVGTVSPSSPLTLYKEFSPDFDIVNSTATHRITGDGGNLLIRADYGNTVANSTMQFSVDGTEYMRINSSGSVGIGTTSPAQKLQINGPLALSNLAEDFTTNQEYAYPIIYAGNLSGLGNGELIIQPRTTATRSIRFVTRGSGAVSGTNPDTRMIIRWDGNVGIGTTSPTNLLHLYGTDGNSYLRWTSDVATTGTRIGYNGTEFRIDQQQNADITFRTNGSERMRITSVGNVGIGTTSPLAATGYTSISLNNASNGGILDLQTNGTSVARLGNNGTTVAFFETRTATPITISTNDTERMRILSGGNIGIGTTTPGSKLQVEGGEIRATTSNAGVAIYVSGTNGEVAAYNWAGSAYLNLNMVGLSHTFQTSGTERMRITSGGNVLIGTTSDNNNKLQVTGTGAYFKGTSVYNTLQIDNSSTSGGGGMYFLQNGSIYGGIGVSGWYLGGTSNDLYVVSESGKAILFATNGGSERMRIGNTGDADIRIGGNFSNHATANRGTVNINGTNTAILSFSTSSTAKGYIYHGGNYMEVWNTDNSYMAFGTNGTERMRILAGGNIGINTTTPGARLEVNGNIYANESSSTAISVYNAGSIRAKMSMTGNEGDLTLYGSSATAKIYLSAYYSSYFNASNVYIGTTSNPLPDNAQPQFAVVGGSGTDAVSIKHTANGNNTFNIWQTGASNHNAIAFYKGDVQANRGNITVTTSGTTYNSVSDYRLKENVVPIENGIDRLMQLKPSKFNWIETGEEAEGFIAHELQEIFPDAVTGEKDAIYSSTGNIKPQSVDYGRITPLLVKALQEQQTQINALKAELDILKNK
jgi:hypothetical protein